LVQQTTHVLKTKTQFHIQYEDDTQMTAYCLFPIEHFCHQKKLKAPEYYSAVELVSFYPNPTVSPSKILPKLLLTTTLESLGFI